MLKLQVVVPTFNHAPFLAETLDSILTQKTQHDYQILVHDDASTDGTREIIHDYAARHPGRFELIMQEENQFQQGRRIATLVWPHYKAQYIAYLDGDDLWTNPDKIQTQIDFMDRNPRCMISQTHSIFFDSKTGETVAHFPPADKRGERTHFEDLAPGNYLLSSAVMHRRSALPVLPADFGEIGFGDYAKFALIARKGWIGLIHVEATKYRIHDNNMWYNKPEEERISKTQRVKAYVAKHAPKPFDTAWTAEATGVPLTPEQQIACRHARKRRFALDQVLGFVQKNVFKLKRILGLRG